MSQWLQDHLDKFVVPYLGYTPLKRSAPYFTKDQMSVIKNAWRSVKDSFKHSECNTLVLPGRDAFIFEILARRENFPTLFIPSCSRMTAAVTTVPEKSFIVDTGFLGTIPKKLKARDYKLLSFRYNREDLRKQIFPALTGSRSLALDIESTPKYWRSGRIIDGAVYQELSDKTEFSAAAVLTIQVYCDSSPRFCSHRNPIERKGIVWI